VTLRSSSHLGRTQLSALGHSTLGSFIDAHPQHYLKLPGPCVQLRPPDLVLSSEAYSFRDAVLRSLPIGADDLFLEMFSVGESLLYVSYLTHLHLGDFASIGQSLKRNGCGLRSHRDYGLTLSAFVRLAPGVHVELHEDAYPLASVDLGAEAQPFVVIAEPRSEADLQTYETALAAATLGSPYALSERRGRAPERTLYVFHVQWSHELHIAFPTAVRVAIQTVLVCLGRVRERNERRLSVVASHVMATPHLCSAMLSMIATPPYTLRWFFNHV